MDTAAALATLQDNLNIVWIIISASLVLFIQAGFTALESGLTRAKNTINVAMKNITDFILAVLIFSDWLWLDVWRRRGWFNWHEWILAWRREQMRQTVAKTDLAVAALNEITAAVNRIDQLNGTIAQVAEQQRQVVNELDTNIHSLSHLAEQNRAGAEQSREHLQILSGVAQELQ